jgi:CheY-like chemotaxis protein
VLSGAPPEPDQIPEWQRLGGVSWMLKLLSRRTSQRWPGTSKTKLNIPFLDRSYSRGEILAKIRAPERHPQRKRVLVADDEPAIRSSLDNILTAAGHEVILTENGAEATRRWREVGADLVILDIFMPEMDGLEALAALRAYAPRLPIIVMSEGQTARMDLLLEAMLLGANWTIAKPFAAAEIMALVDSALGVRPRRDGIGS